MKDVEYQTEEFVFDAQGIRDSLGLFQAEESFDNYMEEKAGRGEI